MQRADTIHTRRGLVERFNDGATPHIVAGYLSSFVYVIVVVLPLYYVLVSAFKGNMEIFGAPLSLPKALSLTNFLRAEEVAVMTLAPDVEFKNEKNVRLAVLPLKVVVLSAV